MYIVMLYNITYKQIIINKEIFIIEFNNLSELRDLFLAARKTKNMTRSELADIYQSRTGTNIDEQKIRWLEVSCTRMPEPVLLRNIASILDIDWRSVLKTAGLDLSE